MKYKILEKVSLACVLLAIIGIFAAIIYSSEDITTKTEVLGQLTCVVSIIGISVTFALWNRDDSMTELYDDDTLSEDKSIQQTQPESVDALPVEADEENKPEAVINDMPDNCEKAAAEQEPDGQ